MTPVPSRVGLRRLRVPAYAFLLVTGVFQVADFVINASPAHLSQVTWRFGLLGIAANSVGNLLLLILLAYAVALIDGDRVVLRVVGAASALLAVLLLAGAASFALDAIQVRPRTDPQAADRFAIVAGQAMIKLVAEAILSIVFAVAALRTAGDVKREEGIQFRPSEVRFPLKAHPSRAE